MGYMGSGKSFWGQKIALQLGWRFADLDMLINKYAAMSTIHFFKKFGEVSFRKIEHDCLTEILQDQTDTVLALGGGTPCYYNNLALINQYSYSIYLQNSIQTLYGRLVKNKSVRPLIAHLPDDELSEFIAKGLFERTYYYNQAQHVLGVDKLSEQQIQDFFTGLQKENLH